jgi:hypothetical protein
MERNIKSKLKYIKLVDKFDAKISTLRPRSKTFNR